MPGKNTKKRTEAAKLREEREAKRGTAKDARFIERNHIKRWEKKPMPKEWYEHGHEFLVIGRLGNIPPDYLERVLLWYRANHGHQYGIDPTEDDLNAAKGLNLMDLVPRFAFIPIKVFKELSEAQSFCTEAAKALDINMQIMQFGQYLVMPPYSTSNIIYPDKEMRSYMQSYRGQEKRDIASFNKRIKELQAETDRSIDNRGTVSQEQLDKEYEERLEREKEQERVTTMHRVETGIDEENADAAAEDAERLGLLERSEYSDAPVISTDEPIPTTVGEQLAQKRQSTKNDRITLVQYERQQLILEARIKELRERIEGGDKAVGILERHDPEDEAIDDIENYVAPQGGEEDEANEEDTRERVKRVVLGPGGKRYKVTLDDDFVPMEDDEEVIEEEEGDEYGENESEEERRRREEDTIQDQWLERTAASSDRIAAVRAPGDERFMDNYTSMQAIVNEANERSTAMMLSKMTPEEREQWDERQAKKQRELEICEAAQARVDEQERLIATKGMECGICSTHMYHVSVKQCACHRKSCGRFIPVECPTRDSNSDSDSDTTSQSDQA